MRHETWKATAAARDRAAVRRFVLQEVEPFDPDNEPDDDDLDDDDDGLDEDEEIDEWEDDDDETV